MAAGHFAEKIDSSSRTKRSPSLTPNRNSLYRNDGVHDGLTSHKCGLYEEYGTRTSIMRIATTLKFLPKSSMAVMKSLRSDNIESSAVSNAELYQVLAALFFNRYFLQEEALHEEPCLVMFQDTLEATVLADRRSVDEFIKEAPTQHTQIRITKMSESGLTPKNYRRYQDRMLRQEERRAKAEQEKSVQERAAKETLSDDHSSIKTTFKHGEANITTIVSPRLVLDLFGVSGYPLRGCQGGL
ncbi:hypothetical protein F52700_11999 [Fusarium sp. NRRL 52700]|nr:hypothetical protein F52700_11999 [Fusarium sp. NRRL 52700]